MTDLDELLQWSRGRRARRKRAAIVVGMHGTQADEAVALHGLERLERGAEVHEAGVATGGGGKRARVQHRRRCRTLGVRIVGVEEFEEARTQAVTAEREVGELRAPLFGEHEARVDDLPVLAV